MVFLSSALWRRITFIKRNVGHDNSFWRKRKVLMMSAHFRGRKQNCYKLAAHMVRRALRSATRDRAVKPKDDAELYQARLEAACEQHGFKFEFLRESLIRSNILLNKKILADLAIWEPRTFKSLTDFAWNKAKNEGLQGINDLGDPPKGVILKPMVIK